MTANIYYKKSHPKVIELLADTDIGHDFQSVDILLNRFGADGSFVHDKDKSICIVVNEDDGDAIVAACVVKEGKNESEIGYLLVKDSAVTDSQHARNLNSVINKVIDTFNPRYIKILTSVVISETETLSYSDGLKTILGNLLEVAEWDVESNEAGTQVLLTRIRF